MPTGGVCVQWEGDLPTEGIYIQVESASRGSVSRGCLRNFSLFFSSFVFARHKKNSIDCRTFRSHLN